ncbi:MAG: peptide deformylase [Bacteroidales bacterium]|jgi:peptide deformylase|nr:peptide deformylase [Bacteroidales bacterium]MBO7257079.1 peptide deformylase [Bacteroidales bacterium]MBO7284012.1 peptide deformylase [Bacteroidales bacterium]
MILPIYVYGSDVLRAKAEPMDIATVNKEELQKLVADMFETMYNAEGVGLAAPQIGKSIRLLVVDGNEAAETYPYLKGFKRVMINPEVVEESEDTLVYGEGCLSVPNIHCDVTRPKSMTVRYYDENLELKEEFLDEFACRMVQHEMDHLEGNLFVDHAAPIRKKMIMSKLHNISKGKTATFYKTKLAKQ